MGAAQMHTDRRLRRTLRADYPHPAAGLPAWRIYVPLDARRVRWRADANLRPGLRAACPSDRCVHTADLWYQERSSSDMGARILRCRAGLRSTRTEGAAHP